MQGGGKKEENYPNQGGGTSSGEGASKTEILFSLGEETSGGERRPIKAVRDESFKGQE